LYIINHQNTISHRSWFLRSLNWRWTRCLMSSYIIFEIKKKKMNFW